ncbi:MAG: hypothetical protein HC906_06505 [Bacteroidales bacterium]|nr:hypothetical protein [Bacteroidales bacterium]
MFGYQPLTTAGTNHWIAKNVPAVKDEPFMNSITNYITKFEFDILDINIPGYFRAYTSSWDAVCKFLYDHEYYGQALQGALYLNDEAKEIEQKFSTPEEKIKAAFEKVKSVKWDENESLFTSSNSMSYVYKKQIGNSSDINFILIQLLRKLDFEADPVIMSTRENGILSPIYPSLNKLNHTIARVKLDGEYILLDATEKYYPYNLLPEKCLNWQGRIMFPSLKSQWVSLEPSGKHKSTTSYEVTLDENMVFTGKIKTNMPSMPDMNSVPIFIRITARKNMRRI